jgi:F-type H+-transporting ATPase subunit delta
VINNTISKRYAKALVQLGSENGLTDQFRKELAVLRSLVQANQGLNDILTSPTYPIERKKLIMKELAGETACSGIVTDFLSLLIDKGRIALLVQIAQEFEQLADQGQALSGLHQNGIFAG